MYLTNLNCEDTQRIMLDKLQRRGVMTLDVDVSHLSVDVVNRYLQIKRRAVI